MFCASPAALGGVPSTDGGGELANKSAIAFVLEYLVGLISPAPELAAVDAIHGLAKRKNWLLLLTELVSTNISLMITGEFVTAIQFTDDTLDAVCRTKLV